jgi:hypothetical protein
MALLAGLLLLMIGSPHSYGQSITQEQSDCMSRTLALMTEMAKGIKEGPPIRKGRIDECALATREVKTHREVAQKWAAEAESCRTSDVGKRFTNTLNHNNKKWERDRRKYCR